MKIAIITPYYKEENEVLTRCIDSVKNQSVPCEHVLVSDGFPNEVAAQATAHHIILPKANGDYGDTPRMIGSTYAYSQGFDAYCWLDADNWYEPDHLEQMMAIINLNPEAEIVTATRNLRRLDGSLLAVDNESNGQNFNDTNCYFVTKPAMQIAMQWGFKPKNQSIIGDRRVWEKAKTFKTDHCDKPTVNYTTLFGLHYLSRNEAAPKNAKVIVSTDNGANFDMWTMDQYMDMVQKSQKQ